jgi:glycine/D-amino acid oxidase-like deaminating enzyme
MLQLNQLSFWERKAFFDGIDFTIIGAGIVGYTTAIQLKDKYPNSRVLILEKGYLPSGASSKNAGFTCFGSPTEIFDDLQKSSEENVWQTVKMRYDGLTELFRIVGGRDIGYEKNGSWDLILENDTNQLIDKSFIHYLNDNCSRLFGKDAVYQEDTVSPSKFGFQGVKTSFFNTEEGQIDTGKLIKALQEIATEKGVISLFGIELVDYKEETNQVRLTTSIGELYSAKLIVCTNGFARQFLGNEVLPARAQVLVTNELVDLPFKGTFHIDRGYYYFRNVDNRILIGGGRNLDFEGETTTEIGTTHLIQEVLTKMLEDIIIPGKKFEVEYQWAGIMGVGENKSPIIRKQSEHVAFGVRMGGMGVAIGSLVGKKLANIWA